MTARVIMLIFKVRNLIPGMIIRRVNRVLLCGLGLLSLCPVMIGALGCQGPAASVKASAVQQHASAMPKPTREPEPSAGATPVETVQPEGNARAGGGPRITVEKDVCDLGDIGIDTKHKGQFKFTNTGSAPLKIILVRTCCGATIKGVDAGQKYAPGQSGTLEFEYQAPSTPNPALSRVLSLQTNDPGHSIVTLTIKAAVVRRVDCKPQNLKLILRRPNAGCPDITLTSLDRRPFSITGFQATGNAITAQFDRDAEATEFVLRPQMDTAKLRQNTRGQISIDLTHPECRNVRLEYDVLPEFTISPPNIMLFGLRAGQAVPQDVSILSNFHGDFEVESISSQKGTAKLLERTKVANGFQLRVEITPPERGSQDAALSDKLEVQIKDGPALSIPLRGFYEDQ